MRFQISALPLNDFAPLFALDDRQLHAIDAKRYLVDRRPGFPCRVSLEDATPGERVILAPFAHQAAGSPYRASGPIFVRENARRAFPAVNAIPLLLRSRLLSVRAYDRDELMTDADVIDGRDVETLVARLLQDERAAYLHVHFARPGCYACRIDRA